MRFGIVKWESFDPVQGIDFGKITITIDALVTNMGMSGYENSSWDSIRQIFHRVPGTIRAGDLIRPLELNPGPQFRIPESRL